MGRSSVAVSIIVGAIILAVAVFWHSQSGRYQIVNSDEPGIVLVVDTRTGSIQENRVAILAVP